MVGASKILTVSYGTFSCTLEGFDDSFSTMKAIAEYFRDLAADDRYFGAEPPVPDAEMLARIAERAVHAPVQARIQDNSVVLRTGEAAEHAAPNPPEPASASLQSPPAPVPNSESVAAKLQRIRAVVSKAKAAEAAATALYEDEETAELLPEAARPGAAPETHVAPDETPAPQEAQVEDAQVGQAAPKEAQIEEAQIEEAPVQEALIEETATEETATEEATAEDTATEEASEEVAAQSQPEGPALQVSPQVSPQPAPSPEQAAVQIEDETAEVAFEEPEYTEDLEGSAPSDAALSALLDRVASEGAQPPQETGESEVDEAEAQEALAENAATATIETEEAPLAAAEITIETETAIEITEEEAEAEAETQPLALTPDEALGDFAAHPGARIVKLKKTEFKAAVETGTLESLVERTTRSEDEAAAAPQEDAEAAQSGLLANIQDTLGETGLSAQDEADLMNELAEVEREAGAATEHEPQTAPALETAPETIEKPIEDETAARLMEETDAQMNAPEGTRRRSAISHLRAAVAATVAERQITGDTAANEPDEAEPYREDLADVIRPRRPHRGNSPARLAPLVLVSEQRIDTVKQPSAPIAAEPEKAPAAPIRPRRVHKGNLAVHPLEDAISAELPAPETEAETEAGPQVAEASDTGTFTQKVLADSTSFAEFAERMGAHEMPDLLEAAAAYTAYVQGQPHFTRPQVMRAVAGLHAGDEFRREDGLRTFGKLLRQGKIMKVKRGQFVVAETTRFNPQTRIAGE